MKFKKFKTCLITLLHVFSVFSFQGFKSVKAEENMLKKSELSNSIYSGEALSDGYKLILDLLSSSSMKNMPAISCDFPFNEVDAMILATVSYLPMCMVPSIDSSKHCEGITLKEWYECLSSIINEKKEMAHLYLHDKDKHNYLSY